MTINQARMESLYQEVCSEFFPDWLSASKWKIVVNKEWWSHGYDFPFPCTCWAEAETHQFEFNQSSIKTSSEWMAADIIYMICYAQICDSAKEGHGREWQDLMRRTADRAKAVGNTLVWRLLRHRIAFARSEREEIRYRVRAETGKPIDALERQKLDAEARRLEEEFDQLLAMYH